MSINYGAACGPWCGWCNACTSAYDRPNDDRDEIVTCGQCGVVIERTSIVIPVTKHFRVVTCSENCAGDFLAQVARMQRTAS